jgi:phenylacetate-CoA ligase
MVTIINPLMIGKVIKHYLSDIHRFDSKDFEKINKFRNKLFLNLVKYAFTVPLYKKKYSEAGISINKIKSLADIDKLPIITREDLMNNYPSKVIPSGMKKKSVLMNTSGSTRNPLLYYTDQFTIMKTLIIYVRELREFGFQWNNSKITIIANFFLGTGPTRYFDSGAIPTLKPFFSLDNFQLLNAYDDLRNMIDLIDKFKPDFLTGFPGPLRHMALLKKQGLGKNVNPKCIISSGGIIDKYDKFEIEEAFGAKIYDFYASTEAGPISFECKKGNFHINSDYIYLETVNKNGKKIKKGKPGILALTRLYGRGTPIIRYTGMEDIISLKKGFCDCEIPTELMDRVHGRIKECVILPNNKIIYANSLNMIPGNVMHNLKTDMIYRIQVVQEQLDEIDILVIIDDKKRKAGIPVKKLLNELKDSYEKLFENSIDVNVKEVKKLRSEESNPGSTPGILSKIDVYKYL